jgi:hypothetical protein
MQSGVSPVMLVKTMPSRVHDTGFCKHACRVHLPISGTLIDENDRAQLKQTRSNIYELHGIASTELRTLVVAANGSALCFGKCTGLPFGRGDGRQNWDILILMSVLLYRLAAVRFCIDNGHGHIRCLR